ncbi:hypothetical protein [Streptomyces sp. CSDS2]|uniref:hypothetical protein n=1 Tax=Streptomyces sp. CSDS2 TaxID=3055051 RepID=UPI0025B0A16C|nr:hypothetical protein [Streptomyces sp. CSDS2]
MLDAWLYEADPVPGCRNCAVEKRKLDQAVEAGDRRARFAAAQAIRQCGHGTGA